MIAAARSRALSSMGAGTAGSGRATRAAATPPSCSSAALPHPASSSRRAILLAGSTVGLGLGLAGTRPSSASAASKSPYERVLEEAKWPDRFPLEGLPDVFSRYDESDDAFFYDQPRLVTHIDDGAIRALTDFYKRRLPLQEDAAILDICSSWISHYPAELKAKRVAGTGMNKFELERNKRLTEFHVQDLNKNGRLPYEAESFDAVTNVVSIDYLTDPLGVMREMHRVLKPGGTFYCSFSNRMFPTKATRVWVESGDLEHVYLVGSFFKYCGASYSDPVCEDISPKGPLGIGKGGDPMWVVYAKKLEA
jgi:SAM-dependent methyltransferase